ncbi:MAG: lactonase family protein [Acidobacteriia bacterium]|nr:lactonase family protein [Terriglobia bacterium]
MSAPNSQPLCSNWPVTPRLLLLLPFLLGPLPARAADPLVYAGTYTNNGSRGIYAFRFQTATGKLAPLGLAAQTPGPSFLAAHPNHRFLYAVNEPTNTVSAFAINPKSARLTLLNQAASRGAAPCHLALDRTGRWLAVANYGSGSVAVLPVGPDGKLGEAAAVVQHHGSGPNPARQKGPHAHCVLFSSDNRFLLAADLGADKIFVYRFDAATGSLTANDPPSASVAPGAGVRHLAFHPNGKVLYAINELASTVTAFGYDALRGALDEMQTVSTLPEGFTGASTTAEIAVNAAGTFVYGSNRGHDSIALLAIDPQRFTLVPMDYAPTLGKTPRHFTLDPTGAYLLAANQDTGTIAVFRVHPHTGQLQPVGRAPTRVPSPVCVLFVAP